MTHAYVASWFVIASGDINNIEVHSDGRAAANIAFVWAAVTAEGAERDLVEIVSEVEQFGHCTIVTGPTHRIEVWKREIL